MASSSTEQDAEAGNGIPTVCPEVVDEGITELWSPAEDQIIADLCFVHGLMGHPKMTWECSKLREGTNRKTAKGSESKTGFDIRKLFGKKTVSKGSPPAITSQSSGSISGDPEIPSTHSNYTPSTCYWPFDLLAKDFDNVRILTYGYDSHPTHWYRGRTTQMNTSQHAQTLLTRLSNARADCRGRPLVFVAHNLGGNLVKDDIVISTGYNLQPDLQDLAASCRAIMFFGTPHLGASAAEYGLILGNIVNALPGGPGIYTETLRGLTPDSETLSNINRRFNAILNDDIALAKKIKIYNFRES